MAADTATTVSGSLAAVRQQYKSLVRLFQELNIPEARLAAGESIDSVEVICPLATDHVISWDVDSISGCLVPFGADIHLSLAARGGSTAYDMPEVSLSGEQGGRSELSEFMQSLNSVIESQGNEISVDVRLTAQKSGVQHYLRQMLSQREDFLGSPEMGLKTRTIVFFRSAAWYRLLDLKALWTWESSGLLSDGRRLVVLLCDASGYLGGAAIEVLGAAGPDGIPWQTMSRESWEAFLEHSRTMCELRTEESNWGIGLSTVTPAHFEVGELAPGLSETTRRLDCIRAALSAAFIANSVQLDHDERQVVLRFAGARPSFTFFPREGDNPVIDGNFSQRALPALATWAYRHGSPDKLLMARECLARDLPRHAAVSLEEVESQAGDALEASKSNFVIYLRRHTQEYFQLRQQAMDAVSDYAEGVEKTISDMTSDLASDVYKVGGLLAGAIAAALIQPAVTVPVLVLAVIVQVIYVLFVALYALPARERRYRSTKDALDKRLAAMTELGVQEREEIRKAASSADVDFAMSYRKAIRIYYGMCMACIVVAAAAGRFLPTADMASHSSGTLAPRKATITPTHR